MRDGFIKIALCSPAVGVADTVHNTRMIEKGIEEAARKDADILLFPSLGVTGSTCGDLFHSPLLQRKALEALDEIVRFSRGFMLVVVVSLPVVDNRRLLHASVVISAGRILGVIPAERVDKRYFTPASAAAEQSITLCRTAVPCGRDLQFVCAAHPELRFAVEDGKDLLARNSAGETVLLVPSAEAESVNSPALRALAAQSESLRGRNATLICTAGEGESTTDFVFRASHTGYEYTEKVLDSEGQFLSFADIDVDYLASVQQREGISGSAREVVFTLKERERALTRVFPAHPFVPETDVDEKCDRMLTLQALGLKQRLSHISGSRVVLGLSGGLDSTLALLVCVRCFDMMHLDRKGIVAVTMPGFGTTGRTRNNATKLAELLDVTLMEIPIGEAVKLHFKDIGQSEKVHDVTYENSQARERTQILMDLANRLSALVVGTGDLSELALGWATYNGDHMSMYSVNGSIPKTLLRHMVRAAAKQDESISEVLLDIVDTPVSPELLPASGDGSIAQKTERIVGPYELHDFFLYYGAVRGYPPKKLFRIACHTFDGLYPREEILKWLKSFYRRFFSQQFKRSCMPDGPAVGNFSLSPRGGWMMPSDASSALWVSEVDEIVI